MVAPAQPALSGRLASPAPRRRSIFTARLVNTAASGEPPQVMNDLRRAIITGAGPPGTLIPIDAVASFFGVSHIPVREALMVLLGEGLVEHVPHVGYSVAKLTFEEFRELYEVRQALESAALRAAVLRATPRDDELVRDAHESLCAAADSGDLPAYHAESRRLHMALIAPARMPRLTHMYEGAWNMTEAASPMSHVSAPDRTLFCSEHDRLVEAFVARNSDRLVAESAEHFEHLKLVLEQVPQSADLFRPSD